MNSLSNPNEKKVINIANANPSLEKPKRRVSSKESKIIEECNKTNTAKNSYVNSLRKNSSRKNSSFKIN